MAKTIAKRKTNKPAPRLASVAENVESCLAITFLPDRNSNLSTLLEIASNLPALRYDAERSRSVLEVDAEGKADLLENINSGALALTDAVKMIGLLVANQDKTSGVLTHDAMVDLGFTINGLADLAGQLLRVAVDDIADAEPVGASHG
jgi:hypothetical protein